MNLGRRVSRRLRLRDRGKVLGHHATFDDIDHRRLKVLRKGHYLRRLVQLAARAMAPVQAKMDATEFVDVGLPFRCS